MTIQMREERQVLIRHASVKLWLCMIVLLPLSCGMISSGFDMLHPGWVPTTGGRSSFLRALPPEFRGALLIGFGLMFLFGVFALLRLLLEPYRARLSSSGIDVMTPLGRERISWSGVREMKLSYGSGGYEGLRILTDKPGMWGYRTVEFPVGGMNRPKQEILGLVAHFRPDLMPGIKPVAPDAVPVPRLPEPERPIVVDSRSWTG